MENNINHSQKKSKNKCLSTKPLNNCPYNNENLVKGEREVGDGAPASETLPPVCGLANIQISSVCSLPKRQRFQLQLEIDLMALGLFALALSTRIYRLQEPRNIVFDELHYGRYVSLYMKGIFFFDSHPPLGKQLLYTAAHLAGYDGNFTFDKIGSPYDDTVPIYALRLVPAVCGSLIVPIIYKIVLETGSSQWTALVTGLLIVFENAFLAQSRFVLMESILLMFSLLGVLCMLKFVKHRNEPYSVSWWLWLSLGSLALGCSFSIKYTGFYSYCLCIFLIGREFWDLLGQKNLSNKILVFHYASRLIIVAALPLLVYVGVFYVHLSMLTKAGPHDSVMTSAFQASLEGGLASITKGQPIHVAHGSQITLRHTHGRMCWLHSHAHVYPVRYTDKRGSSHQQQVTCYSFKDVNNWWIVKRPEKNELAVEQPIDAIRHGDVVQLVHGITSRALNSHDVAAPVSPQSQEVSCYIDYNVSMSAQNHWRVEIVNREKEDATWNTIQSLVHLVHVSTGMALKFSGRQLPDWGFHQHEIVADKVIHHDDTVWNVEEHRYTKTDDKKERERQLVDAEMIPTIATKLSFLDKFLELQYKMLFSNQEYVQNHMFSSEPLEWPFLTRGIAYWVSSETNAQVHLIGNLVIWYSATFSLFLYFIFLTVYLLRRRRKHYDLDEVEWQTFMNAGCIFVFGYFVHFLPYFFVERTLFLHHYLPAYVFKIFILSFIIEHTYTLLAKQIFRPYFTNTFVLLVVIWMFYAAQTFRDFSVLNYGTTDLTENDLLRLRWRDTWDFILHKKV